MPRGIAWRRVSGPRCRVAKRRGPAIVFSHARATRSRSGAEAPREGRRGEDDRATAAAASGAGETDHGGASARAQGSSHRARGAARQASAAASRRRPHDRRTLSDEWRLGDRQGERRGAALHARAARARERHARGAHGHARALDGGAVRRGRGRAGARPGADRIPRSTPTSLGVALARRSGAIKPALLDQKMVAGIGNIYSSEALWVAKISPKAKAASLSAHRREQARGSRFARCSRMRRRGDTGRSARAQSGTCTIARARSARAAARRSADRAGGAIDVLLSGGSEELIRRLFERVDERNASRAPPTTRP